MGEHWKQFQRELHEKVVALEKAHNAEPSLSLETAQYSEQAHQRLIASALDIEAPMLFQMEMLILVTADETGFITSDTPCVWFNPNLYKFPPFYRSPGLAQKDIEVTLPLTPQHLLVISHHKYPQYVDAKPEAIDELNRRTRFHCAVEFVSRNGETRPYWFDPGKEPEESWEKSEEGKRALAMRDRFQKARKDYGLDPAGVPRVLLGIGAQPVPRRCDQLRAGGKDHVLPIRPSQAVHRPCVPLRAQFLPSLGSNLAPIGAGRKLQRHHSP